MNIQQNKPHVLAFIGATASGKTSLALKVARRIPCEIVCLDSMQIYRRMDIGTAKPTAAERSVAPHHMVDIIDPDETFSVAEYVERAHRVIAGIAARGKLPVLVGGTGLYLQGLSYPMDYGGLPSDRQVRDMLNAELLRLGADAMHDKLRAIDPDAASRLHPNDTRRVVRAIEIFQLTGIPMSQHKMPTEADSPYDFSVYAIDWPRHELHERINRRVDIMMEQGLLHEVEALLKSGVSPQAQSMQGLGYKELLPVIMHGASLKDAAEQIKTGTRNYARRQLIWFRRDKRTNWLPAEKLSTAADYILHNLEENVHAD